MKRKIKYPKKLLLLIEMLFGFVSIILFLSVAFEVIRLKKELVELLSINLSYNILFIISMTDFLCGYELFVLTKEWEKGKLLAASMLAIFVVGIFQIMTLNVLLGALLLNFVRKTMQMNNYSIKKIFSECKKEKEWMLPGIHGVILGFTVILVYLCILKMYSEIG